MLAQKINIKCRQFVLIKWLILVQCWLKNKHLEQKNKQQQQQKQEVIQACNDQEIVSQALYVSFIWQFVSFTRVYNSTPTVLVSANHSTTVSGNSGPIHNGITTWIEVKILSHLKLIILTCPGKQISNQNYNYKDKIKQTGRVEAIYRCSLLVVSTYSVLQTAPYLGKACDQNNIR